MAVGVDRRVRLRDAVLLLFHRGQVGHFVGDLAVANLAIGRLDEAVLIDAREGGERIDQPDVRAFGRFDRADAAVMRGMHVAHLEPGAFAREPAGPERRQAALVRDLGQRIGLVHELRKLRGAKEFAHRRRRRLGVDEVLRHDRIDLHGGHALLDRPLHAEQAHAILILHQFADRANAPISQMIDVVDVAAAIAQIDERLYDREDILLAQYAHGVGGVEIETHVHFHATDRRKVVTLAVEEQRVEHRLGAVERRRFAGAHDAVDVEQRILP